MTSKRQFAGILLSALIAGTGSAIASDQTTDLHPTTPYEYWHDYCGYPDVIPNGYEIIGGPLPRMLAAEAMLVRVGQIVPRTDNPNFWRFTAPQQNIDYPGTTVPILGDVPFYGESRLAMNVRTGFLIGPDIMATAPHAIDFDPRNFVVVFNVTAKKNPSTLACDPPDQEHIPASDVFFARASNPVIANTMATYPPSQYGVDMAAYYLDRVPTGHPYMRLRKGGHISSNDALTSVGHPFGLSAKLNFGIDYLGEMISPYYPALGSYPLFDDFYTFEGTSGAAIFNLDRNYVESVIAGGDGGCLYSVANFAESTFSMYDRCDDQSDAEIWPTRTYEVNNAPVSALADLVPTKYLRVNPLNDVEYVVPIGGLPTPSQTTYSATASSSETVNTSISASAAPTSVPLNEPSISVSNYGTDLAPGTTTNIVATPIIPSNAPCGIYDRWVTIIDQTHGFRDRMLHRFEVGMTDVSVAANSAPDIYGIVAPSSPASFSYTLSNTRPTTVTVNIALSAPWLSFDAGSSSAVTLSPVGQSGSTKTVSIKPGATAFSLSNGDYPFTITFAPQGLCSLNAPTVLAGTFHKGVVRVRSVVDEPIYPPTPAGSPISDVINLAASFCVSDVRVRFESVYNVGLGLPLAQWAPDLRIFLDHAGSSTVSRQLWNRDGLPAAWVVPTWIDASDVYETFQMDRVQNVPPIGAASLSAFNNKLSAGQWSFRLYDDGLPQRNPALLHAWEVELRGGGSCLGGG